MTVKFFAESQSEAPVRRDNGRWLVAIATPGQGSSGYYSEDMLKTYGPIAFPSGAKAFINHESSRKPTDMIGVYPDGAYWDEDRKQLMGELEIFSHWKQFVEEVGPHCGVSIYMQGEADEAGNVTKLVENRQNGADLVAYPGLEGSGFVEMLESARSGSENPTVALAEGTTTGKDALRMEEKLDKLIELLTAFVAADTAKAQETAQVEADEALAQERLDAFEASIEAIEQADLTPAQKKALRIEAKAGSDITAAIEAQVALKAEILAEAAPAAEGTAAGRIVTENASTFNTGKVWSA